MRRCFTKERPLGGACVSHFGFLSISRRKNTQGQKAAVLLLTPLLPGAKTLEACGLGSATQMGSTPRANTGAHVHVSAASQLGQILV